MCHFLKFFFESILLSPKTNVPVLGGSRCIMHTIGTACVSLAATVTEIDYLRTTTYN